MTTALIAGQGRLPDLLLAALRDRGETVEVAQFGATADAGTLSFRLESLGGLIETLAARGVARACFAGAIRRPPAVDPALIDAATRPLVPRLMAALGQGDDAALRCVLGLFEEAGIAIVAAHDLLPGLIAPAGVLGRVEPDAAARRDAARAAAIVAAMGAADVGQSCVVGRGQALGIEAQAGTDWMLRALLLMQRDGAAVPPPSARGAVFFKASKPGQDRRVDLPAIGPDTVALAAELGLSGLVLEAGSVLLLERAEIVARADAAGLFLWSREG